MKFAQSTGYRWWYILQEVWQLYTIIKQSLEMKQDVFF